MNNTFLISDTHFGHKGVTQFLNDDGTKLRPWDNTEDMDEALVGNWNKVVRPKDKVYHLGDVVINRKAFPTLARLNGEKVLIKGNHDLFRLDEYTPYFKDIRGCHPLAGMILTHIPLHKESLSRWTCNIHGHLHNNNIVEKIVVRNGAYAIEVDTMYYNVSVERINYTPISLEDLLIKVKEQQNDKTT